MARSKTVWRVGLRLAICVILLGWLFHTISMREGRAVWEKQGGHWHQLSRLAQWQIAWSNGPRELWRTLTLVHPREGAESLVCMGATIFLGMIRWRMVLRVQGLELTLGRATEISLVAHFFNSFLLGSTGGDLMKAYYAARETHHLKAEAVTTVLVDRLIGLLSMLAFAVVMILPNLNLLRAHHRLAALSGVSVLMLIAGATVVVVGFWGGVSRHWPKARAWLHRLPRAELIERGLDACRRFGHEPVFLLKAVGLSMIINVFCVLQIWALVGGLELHVPLRPLLVIVPTIICIAALPITPSGLGVRENLYVWMLAVPAFRVLPAEALSLSLLAYAGSLFWSLVGGVVYLTFKQRHHLAEVAAVSAAPAVAQPEQHS